VEVVLGNLVDLGLRDLFGDALAGGEGVSRGDSCGERSELMSMAVSEEKAQGIRISELYIFVELNRSKYLPAAANSRIACPRDEGDLVWARVCGIL